MHRIGLGFAGEQRNAVLKFGWRFALGQSSLENLLVILIVELLCVSFDAFPISERAFAICLLSRHCGFRPHSWLLFGL